MEEVKINGKYRHYKGNTYTVIGIGRHSDTLEEMVIYQGHYNSKEFGKNPIWLRPKKEFLEDIELEGKKIKRFQKTE